MCVVVLVKQLTNDGDKEQLMETGYFRSPFQKYSHWRGVVFCKHNLKPGAAVCSQKVIQVKQKKAADVCSSAQGSMGKQTFSGVKGKLAIDISIVKIEHAEAFVFSPLEQRFSNIYSLDHKYFQTARFEKGSKTMWL